MNFLKHKATPWIVSIVILIGSIICLSENNFDKKLKVTRLDLIVKNDGTMTDFHKFKVDGISCVVSSSVMLHNGVVIKEGPTHVNMSCVK